jgi:hypothetical protein
MYNQGNQIDVMNTITGKIANIVEGIGDEPCEKCEVFHDYIGKCKGFSWDMTYHPSTHVGEQGTWSLSVYHHTKEIWYIAKDGTFVDIILAAYEKLASGEWKKTTKETWRDREEKM